MFISILSDKSPTETENTNAVSEDLTCSENSISLPELAIRQEVVDCDRLYVLLLRIILHRSLMILFSSNLETLTKYTWLWEQFSHDTKKVMLIKSFSAARRLLPVKFTNSSLAPGKQHKHHLLCMLSQLIYRVLDEHFLRHINDRNINDFTHCIFNSIICCKYTIKFITRCVWW